MKKKFLVFSLLPILCSSCRLPGYQYGWEIEAELHDEAGFVGFFKALKKESETHNDVSLFLEYSESRFDEDSCRTVSEKETLSWKQDFSSLMDFSTSAEVQEISKAEENREWSSVIEHERIYTFSFKTANTHDLSFSSSCQVFFISTSRERRAKINQHNLCARRYYRWGEGSRDAFKRIMEGLKRIEAN